MSICNFVGFSHDVSLSKIHFPFISAKQPLIQTLKPILARKKSDFNILNKNVNSTWG
jgi:hypothetical protein